MRDLIKELKENKCAFGLMDKELQDKAKEIGHHCLEMAVDEDDRYIKWVGIDHIGRTYLERTYRLKPDYTEQPDRIELEITVNDFGYTYVKHHGTRDYYTNAPALCPKPGYRFVGYRYQHLKQPRCEPVIWLNRGCLASWQMSPGYGIKFPTHAVYERETK